MGLRRNKIFAGFGIVVAVATIVGARAGVSTPPTGVATQRISPSERGTERARLELPGVVVLASAPTLNEILDIILGDGPSASTVASGTKSSTEESRIAAMLRKRTSDAGLAQRIAAALVREGKRANIESTLLVGILLTENPDLEPRATSSVGARGLMQVMPFHAGHWGCPSNDLFDIDSNICHGVRILADNLRHSSDLPAALLRYNGCVRGTNTPDCHAYARRVYSYARRTALGPDGRITALTPFASLNAPSFVNKARSVSRNRAPHKGVIAIPKELLVE